MPKRKIDFDTVSKLALELPEVEESTAWGSRALKLGGKLLACIPTNKAAEPDSLVVRIDFDRRAELLETAPDVYYCPNHYVNYPAVLVRLSHIQADALRDLLLMSWRFVSAEKPKSRAPRSRPRR
jgi:hypothetical protein